MAAAVAANLAAGCASPQDEMNEVQRAAWAQRIGAARGEWREAERELWLVEERLDQLRKRTADERAQLEKQQAAQRVRAAELAAALQTLRSIEEDLVTARARRSEIEQELQGVRALEAQLADREQRLAELSGQIAELDARLAAKEEELAAKRASVAAAAEEIDRALARLGAAEAKMRAALEEARAGAEREERAPAPSPQKPGEPQKGGG